MHNFTVATLDLDEGQGLVNFTQFQCKFFERVCTPWNAQGFFFLTFSRKTPKMKYQAKCKAQSAYIDVENAITIKGSNLSIVRLRG